MQEDRAVRISKPWKRILESIVREVAEPVRVRPKPGKVLKTPRAVWLLLKGEPWVSDEREHFVLLALDGKHRLKKEILVSIGTLAMSLVHPREVFRPAIEEGAAGVIVVHNHPSGDPTPSAEDLQVTRRLEEAGKLLGIPLLDHVVVTREGFRGLADELG